MQQQFKTVSATLGHHDAGFTLRTSHATRQALRSAAHAMGSIMSQVM
ncbi:hypothetical protein [Lawsonibacter faecis]|uniref:Uncharacterized protein n=1 Tax=Lawsonibacter faecis TaxID=2763052 RepID=A0A8J6MCQ4_9FIRM|nr:hypothetical protein [Lawsonibacter faecis]MBC5737106.1 hypothetical protein [Lawsonibacter faecis]